MKKEKMNAIEGFTLIELIIVIILVSILAIISVPIYKYNAEKAYLAEAFTNLRAIADANTVYYIEHKVWVNDIRVLPINIEGTLINKDNMWRIENENFIYACAGDSSTSNTIATVNRKPFKERYWFSFSAVPSKKAPNLGKYAVTGDATYAKSKKIDKKLVEEYKSKYN